MSSEPYTLPEPSPISMLLLPLPTAFPMAFAGWSTIDLSKRREAVKVREEDGHKPRMRDSQ